MPTLAVGSSSLRPARWPLGACAQRGLTLIELLVVLGILLLAWGMVLPALAPREQRRLQSASAQLLAHLEAARSTALVQGRPLWLLPTAHGWELREHPQSTQRLHQVVWPEPGLTLTVLSPQAGGGVGQASPALRIGPDPVQPKAELLLRMGQRQVVLHNPTLAGFEVKP